MYKKGLKIIWKYLKEYRRDLIILSILGVFSATANGIIPFISGRLFDAILNDNIILFELFREISIPTWLFFIILWALIQLIGSVIDWRIGIKSQLVSHAAYVDYLSDGYGKLLNLPMSFFKNEKIGDLSDKMNKAASLLSTIIGNIIIYLAPQFLSIFVALGVSFSINYLLSFIILAGLAAYVVIMFKYVRPTVELYKEGHVAYGKAFGTIFEAMGNVGAIKQSVAEDYERKRIRFYLKNKVTSIWANIYKNWEKLSFYQRLIIVLTQLAIFLISVSLVRNDTITIGELVMFNGYASMVFGPFVVLGRNWQFLQNGIVAMERAERVLQTTAETYEPEKSFHLDEIKGDIEFKDVSFSYKNGKPVLENINLKIKQGEVVALVGESGVGKSTLIDLISAYHFPNKGKVLIDDHDIRRIKLKFLRQNIAVVPQETVLFSDTIKTNIKYGSFKASDGEIEEAAKKAHALEFIEKFPKKWKQIVGERGVKLSVGQKQRVSIARAILRNPKILILDEPTSALDAKSEMIIQKSLEELMQGRTTFIIAHRLSTVRKADKIIVFEKGGIMEQGKHDELIRVPDGVYRKLYELQIGLHE
ncbi:TPA: hypothetical protein DEW47_01055 [Patescibacteria group bacterium]|nr:MAG: ABC-type multidrug transport system, ATPase and permease component [Parcubacteria group bacterium GW2011_GWF2_40_10]KKR47343.1 MAG: ABC-type multidrug transport system, ATPase and permease component [Parcubacteria group bacterium GW2011_GWA2_40_143]KKR59985.1 MAG: ABC-type multidrug transport system, ATPase and permease component [Parcubacteria group bacterium GW2011_GWC2_40_31]KKR76404.1 MAG: ABC-type multidrug transport system, ATPase and permease component [Parcubacteria group bacteri